MQPPLRPRWQDKLKARVPFTLNTRVPLTLNTRVAFNSYLGFHLISAKNSAPDLDLQTVEISCKCHCSQLHTRLLGNLLATSGNPIEPPIVRRLVSYIGSMKLVQNDKDRIGRMELLNQWARQESAARRKPVENVSRVGSLLPYRLAAYRIGGGCPHAAAQANVLR